MASKQAAASGKKRKIVNVHLLNGDERVIHVDVKSKFQEVFNQVAGQLCLRETEYFGLAFRKDNEYHFIVLDEKIHKLAPKQWKSGSGEGTDSQGKALINLWFRVQFYVDQVILLREKVTRHQYYLQLKENVLQYNHLYNEEKCFQLAAYALQADHGNYLAERHQGGYFNPALYFPQWMLDRHGVDYLANNMPTIHKDLHNLTKNDAELRYIRNASMPPGGHNLHFYTVRKRKSDKVCDTWLAICAKGVEVYEDDAGYKNHISTFLWKDIAKLYFDKKKFEIRSVQSAGGRRFMYYTDCDVKSKYLLTICRSTHMFQMAIQPKLMEIHHLDNEDQKRYRESYVYSEGREKCNLQHSPSKSMSVTGSSTNQRFSVISDASSNTTSGIVSDRMAVSFDDGDDHTREFMIDCPPRSAVGGTPSQIRSKFQPSFSFKQSPQGSKASPVSAHPHSLDLCKPDAGVSPSQELSPTSSTGSWRLRHHPGATPMRLMSLPSPTTPTQDTPGKGLRRSGGRRDSFSKSSQLLPPGSLLLTSGERNTSGDSAVSLSGIFCGSGQDKLAPLSLPQSELRGCLSGSPGPGGSVQHGGGGRGSGGSSTYSLTPPLNLAHLKKTGAGPSPPTSLNFAGVSSGGMKDSSSPRGGPGAYSLGRRVQGERSPREQQLKSLGSPRELCQQQQPAYKLLPSPLDISDKLSLSSPRANIHEHYPKPVGSPRGEGREVTSHKTLNSPQDLGGKAYNKPLPSPRDKISEQLKLSGPSTSSTHHAMLDFPHTLPASPSPRATESVYSFPIISALQQQQQQQQQQPVQTQSPQPQQLTNIQAPLPPPAEVGAGEFHQSRGVEQQPLEGSSSGVLTDHTLLASLMQHQQQQQLTAAEKQSVHLQQQQQHQQPLFKSPAPAPSATSSSAVTDHYLLALRQGNAQLAEKSPSAQRAGMGGIKNILEKLPAPQAGLTMPLADHMRADQKQQHQQVAQPLDQRLQQQQQVAQPLDQRLQQQHQNQQQYQLQDYIPYGVAVKDSSPQNKQIISSDAGAEMEENKENVYHQANDFNSGRDEQQEELMEEPVVAEEECERSSSTANISEAESRNSESTSHSGNKGVLHPELKQILGQSHAISLPLITALCNDSSLVQASRSQSGSRSSYDTSTMRSTDSRLTRLSHDTDPRRWSSCCQAAGGGVPEVMLSVQSSRPYSWHSEHFDLDSHSATHPRQLALLPAPSEEPNLPTTSPPNPRAVLINNKQLALAGDNSEVGGGKNNVLLLPQKMIESDPGPSSPHTKSGYSVNISWWDAPPSAAGSDPGSSSWVDALPYSLPPQHLPNKHPGTSSMQHLQHHHHPHPHHYHQHQHQQQPLMPRQNMVPHKLSSGGHRDSDSSIAHKQIMKENIGIA
ncbi:uncharacterized protein LOC101863416 [Aplysia californica]|uniref:Uncharacterized protein LOC101863416 n=1 Tax=Aplysia californica TaxID=6500 RepID=A0ABM0JGX7_APLCA|nr:uncharacterized protein LOC101863416 [Aplysia californica]